jgi:hypothetical protein
MNYTTAYTSPEILEAAIPLRFKLKQILMYHSAQEVHTTLRQLFEEDYQFYQTLFHVPQPAVPPPPPPVVVEAVPLAQFQVPETQEPPLTTTTRISNNTRIRVVKREQEAPPAPAPEPTQDEEAQEPKEDSLQSLAERKAAIKRDNAEKTQKKYQELVSKGITPKTLLTKENLEKWVKDGLSYTQIARDHVGIDAEEIGAIARGFGIKSNIAMKRAVILANKK